MTGRFVAIGTGHYQDPAWTALPAALTDIDALTPYFVSGGLDASSLRDSTEEEIRQGLKRLRPPSPGPLAGTLVLYWSGHGQIPPEGGLRLIAADSEKGDSPTLTAGDITSLAARSGAAHILLIFDTCYSGVATPSVVARAISVLSSSEGTDLWVGMIAAAMDWQKAGDGRFSALLSRMLEKGPCSEKALQRWSEHDEGITADALIYALIADWDDSVGQHPEQTQWGRGWPGVVVRNPRFSAAAPARVVEQLIDAARGGQPGEEWYFAGRGQVLAKLTEWIRAGQPGVRVLTGPAGSGKSAVLGQLLCLSDPLMRQEVLRHEAPAESSDPGAGAIHAHLAARGLTVSQAVRAIDEQLSDRGVIPGDRRGKRGRGELLDAAEAAAVRPVVVIDGLDEAGSEAWQMAEKLIRPLSACCVCVIGTRELAAPDGGAPLIARLQPDASQVISLLAEADDNADVRTYVRHRLAGRDARMDPDPVAASLIAQRAHPGEGLFLLARVLTAQLRAEPVDTASPDWQLRLSRSVEEAFDRDLQNVPALEGADGLVVPGAARDLLTALAWSFGAGLPDDLWAPVAGAISGRTYTTDEVYFALRTAGRYIIEDGDGGRAVYRLAHQRLVSHLRSATPERAPLAIARALTGLYGQLLDAGNDLARYRYLTRFTWRHCVEGDIPGLGLLLALGANHPEQVQPDVAVAFRWFGEHRTPADDTTVTISAFEQARAAYAALTRRDVGYSADLARTLDGLGVAYSWARRPEAVPAAKDAAEMFRLLSEVNPAYLPDYASSLVHLGMRYDEAARFEEALEAVRTATEIYDRLAEENSAFRPGLATATLNLSLAYSNLHQDREAADAAMRAFIAFTELTAENPGYRSELARAGANVGARFAAIDEMAMAVAAAESSVELLTKLSAEDPGQRSYLAEALNAAGNVYHAARNSEAALSSARQAADLLRELSATDPRQRPRYALALSNLSNREADAGHASDAVAPALEAAAILREDAASHPGRTVDLAASLVNLSIRLEESDPMAAGQVASEAVQLCVALPADAKTNRVLASAFNSASRALRRIGRPAEAADAAAMAVQIYQRLAVAGQVPLGHLLGALTTLTRAHLDNGNQAAAEEAWQVAREAFSDSETKAQFLVAEAKVTDPDRARAALVAAAVSLEVPSVLTFQVRQLLRARYRTEPDALNRAWTERTGGLVPGWMGLDPDLCRDVLAWFTAPDLEQTKALHAANLDRFATEEALAAFDEVAPMVIDDDEIIAQYREAMIAARSHGLDELYPASS